MRLKNTHCLLCYLCIIFQLVIPFLFLNSFKKPKCEFPTILDMLEIDDAVIANCLIDQVINVQY